MHLRITHRNRPLSLPTTPSQTLSSLRHAISTTLSIPVTHIRLLSSSKILPSTLDDQPLSAIFTPNQRLVVIATAPESLLPSPPLDVSTRPFANTPPKYTAAPTSSQSKLLSNYRFHVVEALPNLPDRPQAQRILEALANDRGFLRVLQIRKWSVGALKEMPPEGRVGVDPVCVLGYNTNMGQSIHLRLRTDDMTGFRSPNTIRQVLAHELAHNEIKDHDDTFKELMRWIERTADKERGGDGTVLGGALGGQSRLLRMDDANARREEESGEEVQSLEDAWGHWRHLHNDHELDDEEEDDDDDEHADAGVRDGQALEPPSSDLTSVLQPPPASEPPHVSPPNEQMQDANAHAADDDLPTIEPTPATQHPPSAIDQLMALGFTRALCEVALRECSRDVTRAAEWLFEQLQAASSPQLSNAAVYGGGDDATGVIMRRVRGLIRSLSAATAPEATLAALNALHLYLCNLCRHPGEARYARINAANAAFQTRVAAFRDACDVLKEAGWSQERAAWMWTGRDIARVYVVKRVVQEELVRRLVEAV